MAAHDVGQYVNYYPNGRALVERLRGKVWPWWLLTLALFLFVLFLSLLRGGVLIGPLSRVACLQMIIMGHLSHESEAVRYEALVCVQKLMSTNWGLMAAGIATPGPKGTRK